MLSATLSLVLLSALAAADDGITLQVFANSCKEEAPLMNINTNSGDTHFSSGCQAVAFNQSQVVANSGDGFRCNFYSDSGCQSFMTSRDIPADDQHLCIGFTGPKSVLCFSQALFDNPFAESTVTVSVGTNIITTNPNPGVFVLTAIGQACSESACDPGNKFSNGWSHFNKDGQQTASLTGHFQSANQRDYMGQLMNAAIQKTTTNFREDTKGSAETADKIVDVPAFFQVVVRDHGGNEQASMAVSLDVTVNPPTPGNCGIVGSIESAALGAIPEVGSIVAKAFEATCAQAG